MSVERKHYYTIEEYFALEKVGHARYEYWDGEIVCMSGGSEAHNLLCANIHGELYLRLKGRECRALTAETPIKTPTFPPYRYPNASLVCGKPEFETIGGIAVLTNPLLIVEVLSPQTALADRGIKFDAYKAVETVQEYLLIEQDLPHITHYIKQENGEWQREDITGESSEIILAKIDIALTLNDIYQGIRFD